MASQNDEPMVMVTIRCFTADIDFLKARYDKIGYNRVIRQLVHNHCEKIRTKLQMEQVEEMNGDS